MKMRLTAGRSAAGAVLLAISISACTGGSASSIPATFTPSPATPSAASSAQGGSRTPSPNEGSTAGRHATATGTSAGSAPAAGKASASAKTSSPVKSSGAERTKAKESAPATHSAPVKTAPAKKAHAPASATLAHVPPAATRYPNAAPETGGGGTTGLQDGVLFAVGGGAILLGLASLAYRRRLARHGRAAD